MKMIIHEAIGMHLPIGFSASFGKSAQEPHPICVIQENGFPPVATIHYVINSTRVLNPKLAGHGSEIGSVARIRNKFANLPCCWLPCTTLGQGSFMAFRNT